LVVLLLPQASESRTFQKSKIFYTVALDTIGMILAFFGQLAPIFAALIHVGAEPACILNSAPTFPASRCASTLVIDHSVRNALVNSPRKAASFTCRKIHN